MDECSSCYNSLKFLNSLDPEIGIEYVFLEDLQQDSASIKKVLNLPDKGKFIWSDELYRQCLFEGMLSSVVFQNSSGHHKLIYSLKDDFKQDLASFFNSLLKSKESYSLDTVSFSLMLDELFLDGNYFYVLNQFENTLTRIDRFHAVNDTVISLDSHLVKEAYLAEFGVDKFDSAYHSSLAIIKELELVHYFTFKSFLVRDNKIYLFADYKNFSFKPTIEDTIGGRFIVLHVFDINGGYIETIKFQDIDTDEAHAIVKDTYVNPNSKLSFFDPDPISFGITNDHTFLISIYGFLGKESESPLYYVGEYEIDANTNELVFKRYYPYGLGKRYSVIGYAYSNVRFSWDGAQFTNGLDDIVFQTNDASNVTDLDIISKDEIPQTYNTLKNYIFRVNQDEDYFYLFLLKNSSLTYAKVNIHSLEKEIKDISFLKTGKSWDKFIMPDNIDYNYMIVPTSSKTYTRVKIF